MKKLFIGLLLLASMNVFANSENKIAEINNIIDSVESSVDNYHYGRLKGYLEGLSLEKGFSLSDDLSEMEYRMHLVALKVVLNNIKVKYPDVNVKSVMSSIGISGVHNSSGSCYLHKDGYVKNKHLEKRFEINIRDFTGEQFKKYTVPVINKCIRVITSGIEEQL